MTSDEMIEKFKELRQKNITGVDISIAPLMRDHPEQLDDFINKFVAMQIEELELEEGESRDEIRETLTASELSSLLETAHLLRSPKNAERLLKALHRAQAKTAKPKPLEKLRKELGLDETV